MPPELTKHMMARKGEAVYSLRAGERRKHPERGAVRIDGFATYVYMTDQTGACWIGRPEDLL